MSLRTNARNDKVRWEEQRVCLRPCHFEVPVEIEHSLNWLMGIEKWALDGLSEHGGEGYNHCRGRW